MTREKLPTPKSPTSQNEDADHDGQISMNEFVELLGVNEGLMTTHRFPLNKVGYSTLISRGYGVREG